VFIDKDVETDMDKILKTDENNINMGT